MAYVADPEWEWYIGELFYKLIASFAPSSFASVVEFAPGFRYKIGNALAKLNFSGTLYVIDSNPGVIRYVLEKYEALLPNASLIGINKSLNDAASNLPSDVDLFLSNHSIDDMIISLSADNSSVDRIFNDDPNAQSLLVQAWEKLSKEPLLIPQISKDVIGDFTQLFEKVRTKFVIMSQYRSNDYLQNDIASTITNDVFLRLKKLIPTDDAAVQEILNAPIKEDDQRFFERSLLDNVQNAENWIAGTFDGRQHD